MTGELHSSGGFRYPAKGLVQLVKGSWGKTSAAFYSAAALGFDTPQDRSRKLRRSYERMALEASVARSEARVGIKLNRAQRRNREHRSASGRGDRSS